VGVVQNCRKSGFAAVPVFHERNGGKEITKKIKSLPVKPRDMPEDLPVRN
jgi:hypothetical protein